MRTCKIIPIVLKSNEQHEHWKKIVIDREFSNMSQMVRYAVKKLDEAECESNPVIKMIESINNTVGGFYKLIDLTNEKIDIIDMRLSMEKGTSKVIQVAKDILDLLLEKESDIPEIVGKFNYNRDVLNEAIVLINDLGLIGSRRKKSIN